MPVFPLAPEGRRLTLQRIHLQRQFNQAAIRDYPFDCCQAPLEVRPV